MICCQPGDTRDTVCLDFVLEQPRAVDDIIRRQTLYLFVHLIVHGHFLQRRHFALSTQFRLANARTFVDLQGDAQYSQSFDFTCSPYSAPFPIETRF